MGEIARFSDVQFFGFVGIQIYGRDDITLKVNHIHFKTPDVNRTAQWYIEILGAQIVSENKNADGSSSFRLDLPGIPMNVTGCVSGQELNQTYGLEHVALDTDEFDTTLQLLKDKQISILEERARPNGGRIAFFEGPDGVRLEILEIVQ